MSDEPLILPEAGELRRGRHSYDASPAFSGPPALRPALRLVEPERTPLSVLELHLLTLRERVDDLTNEHALMRRLLHELYAAGAICLARRGGRALLQASIDSGWEEFDLHDDELTILRALLAAEEPRADQ